MLLLGAANLPSALSVAASVDATAALGTAAGCPSGLPPAVRCVTVEATDYGLGVGASAGAGCVALSSPSGGGLTCATPAGPVHVSCSRVGASSACSAVLPEASRAVDEARALAAFVLGSTVCSASACPVTLGGGTPIPGLTITCQGWVWIACGLVAVGIIALFILML